MPTLVRPVRIGLLAGGGGTPHGQRYHLSPWEKVCEHRALAGNAMPVSRARDNP